MEKMKCGYCGGDLGGFGVDAEYFSVLKEGNKLGEAKGLICNKCIIKESKIDKLYHTSTSLDEVIEFIPRVPELRAPTENDSINRICLSSSLEGCLTASPYPGYRIHGHFFWQDNSSFLIRVYEFDIDELNVDKLIPPEYLYYSESVGDAYFTDEYWCMEAIKPSRSYFIELKSVTRGSIHSLDYADLIKLTKEGEELGKKYKFCDFVEGIDFDIVPEEKRSHILNLDYKVENIKIEDEWAMWDTLNSIHPSIYNFVKLEEIDGEVYISGKLDTRNYGTTNTYSEFAGEVNKDKVIDYINSLSIMKIIS